MIRFCDSEISTVGYDELKNMRGIEIWEYFYNGHMDETIYVVDADGKYVGRVTRYSLTHGGTVDKAILKDRVVFGANLLESAREFFSYYNGEDGFGRHVLLTVVDGEGELVCFAYDDSDGNREIRMLRELMDMTDAMQFTDIYPEYKYVKIDGFNELAYIFAKYIEEQGIPVCVAGTMWEGHFGEIECQVPDYECLTIHAEGIGAKNQGLLENLLKGVAVEFECIDIIYETNIKKGMIKDTVMNITQLLEYLRKQKEVVLLGIDRETLDVYDYLMENEIEISAFADSRFEGKNRKIFGKKIMSGLEVRKTYDMPVFIDCTNKNSAWGLGIDGVDYYDYLGYRRNKNYILIKDYIDISCNNLINVLKRTETVLAGDVCLCRRLYDYLEQMSLPVKGYLNVLSEGSDQSDMPEVMGTDSRNDVVLIVVPEYFRDDGEWKKRKNKVLAYLEENEMSDYTDYFSDMVSFIKIENSRKVKYASDSLLPKRIVFGSIDSYCGNEFFRGLLDGHPDILKLNYGYLNNNLFWICVRLSIEDSVNIFSALCDILEQHIKEINIDRIGVFKDKLKELLSHSSRFTSQELFLIIHLAFMYTYRYDIKERDIRNIVIYWEPHFMERSVMEECAEWLGAEAVPCTIFNLVRNICMRTGSGAKGVVHHGLRGVFAKVIHPIEIEKKRYEWCDRMVMKFEDLKCAPRENLTKICKAWGISWSDILMVTTSMGREHYADNYERQVKDFDLEPVYNTYERFFSEFDRMRIMLIHSPYQRKYGYPYVELKQFTRREVQDMFLKRFRFENMGDTEQHKDSMQYRIYLQSVIKERLQIARKAEYDSMN